MSHGRHIKILGKASADLLNSPDTVHNFLIELVHRLGMRALGSPIVYSVPIEISRMGAEPFEDEGGVTGTLVLSTSHCAIHTWPAREFFVMDCYSCRDFETAGVTECLARFFAAHHLRVSDLSFSLRYEE